MVTETRCDRSDLPTWMCGHCLGHTLPDGSDEGPLVLDPPVAWTVAEWSTRCPGPCDGNYIRKGDPIARCSGRHPLISPPTLALLRPDRVQVPKWVCAACAESAG